MTTSYPHRVGSPSQIVDDEISNEKNGTFTTISFEDSSLPPSNTSNHRATSPKQMTNSKANISQENTTFISSDLLDRLSFRNSESRENLVQFSSDDYNSHQSFPESLQPIRIAQYNDTPGQSELVQYNDGREGVTLTALPLISGNEFVNLVDMGSGLSVDNSLDNGSSVLLRSDFNGSSNENIVSEDKGINDHTERKTTEGGFTFLATSDNESISVDHPITISGVTDGQGNPVTVPLSFLNTPNGQALLQELGILADSEQNGLFLSQVSGEGLTPTTNILHQTDSESHNFHQEISASNVEEKEILVNSQPLGNQFKNKTPVKLASLPSGTAKGVNKGTNRILGSGPLAISAQGILEQVNGRTVTVLPRPEDLRKLLEQKALVVNITDEKPLASPKKRGPVPVIPHQRFRRGRGKRGRPRTVPRGIRDNTSIPQRGAKRGRRGRRGKRGRGSSSVLVVNSSGRRPGRPRKATTLIEGPNGARMIHTGPPTVKEEPSKSDEEGVSTPSEDKYFAEDTSKKTITVSPTCVVKEEVLSESGKRRLPPRARGTKYSKMIEALMRPDDDIPSGSSDEDTNGKGQVQRPSVYRTGKRGRPRKQLAATPSMIKLMVSTASYPRSTYQRLVYPPNRTKISVNTGIPKRSPLERSRQNYIFNSENSSRIFLCDDHKGGLSAIHDNTLSVFTLNSEQVHITVSSVDDEYRQYRSMDPGYSHNTYTDDTKGRSFVVNSEDSLDTLDDDEDMSDVENNVNLDNISMSEVRERVESDTGDEKEGITLVTSHEEAANRFDLEINEQDSKLNVLPFSNDENVDEKRGTGIYLASSNDIISDQALQESSVIEIKEEAVELTDGHECQECGEVLDFKRDYIRHLRYKHDIRAYECSQCLKTFTSILALQDHESVHSLENPFMCSICNESFDRYASLRTHMKTSHESECEFSCSRCGEQLSSAAQLKKHQQMHSKGLAFSCEECGKLLMTEEALEDHMKTHIKDKNMVCDICNMGFFTSGGLNKHRKIHKPHKLFGEEEDASPDLICKYCYATFTYESSLQKHTELLHTTSQFSVRKRPVSFPLTEENVVQKLKEQLNVGYAPKNSELYDLPGKSETLEGKTLKDPFRCGICEETFTDVDVMCEHFGNNHTGTQKFYCDLCIVGCASEEQMARHKQVHENEEQQSQVQRKPNDLPNLCMLCGKSYETPQLLAKHSKGHNIDKPFECSICHSHFPLKSALRKHLLVHTGERPFKCDVCLKSFRQSAALVRHKLWTHKLKNQNKCELCGKTFFTSALLVYHLDVHGAAGRKLKDKLENIPVGMPDDNNDKAGKSNSIDPENNPENKCEYCEKKFPSRVVLLSHQLTHKLSASYTCEYCFRTFREKRYLQKHKLTHKGVRSWKCDICQKGFAAKLTLIRHSQVHIREALKPSPNPAVNDEDTVSTLPADLRCDDCSITFLHRSHYVRHKLLHSGTPLLKCGLCDKMFVHKSDIIRHKVMHSFLFTCDVCGRNFHRRSLYLLHKKKHSDAKPYKCTECDKSFTASSNYVSHMRTHNGDKPYRCDECPYRCSQSGRLTKHKKMHVGIKPFKCATCGKCFANAESVRIHHRLHTGERPYKCQICSKGFINNGSLSQHLKDHALEEIYKCTLCSHKFRRASHLQKHQMYHDQQVNGDSPPLYMCDVCGRVFEKKKYLYTHGNVHNRQKTYNCGLCNKQLASRMALRNHEHIHSGEMPYKCLLCNKDFRSNSNLKRHMRTHEGEPQPPPQQQQPQIQQHHIAYQCNHCNENFFTEEDLNDHYHQMHVMMVNGNTATDHTSDPTQLYVLETMGDDMDSNTQQPLFVGTPQPLLVFNENSNSQFDNLPQSDAVQRDDMHADDMGSHTYETESVMNAIGNNRPVHMFKAEEFGVVIPVPEEPIIRHTSHEDQQQLQVNIFPEHQQSDMETQPGRLKVQQDLVTSEVRQHTRQAHQGAGENKPHVCTVCNKTFAKKQYLTKHMYRHRAVKPHTCNICGKGFAQKFEVVVHKIKHTGEKPYSCDVCNKQFRSKVNLANHKMRHNGEFPFLCSVCRKGFSTQLQLERHVSLHAGGMYPYTCQLCNKGYSIEQNLRKHMIKHHNTYEIEQPEVNEEEHVEYVQVQDDMVDPEASFSGQVGQISIRPDEEMMSTDGTTVTLLHKPSAILSHSQIRIGTTNMSLALQSNSNLQSINDKDENILRHLQSNQNEDGLSEQHVKIEGVPYSSFSDEMEFQPHSQVIAASLDSYEKHIKGDPLSLITTSAKSQFTNSEGNQIQTDPQFSASENTKSNTNNVNIIEVPQSMLKEYYIHSNGIITTADDIPANMTSFLQSHDGSSDKQIDHQELQFASGDDEGSSAPVINLNEDTLNILTSSNHQQKDHQTLVNVVVSQEDSIDDELH